MKSRKTLLIGCLAGVFLLTIEAYAQAKDVVELEDTVVTVTGSKRKIAQTPHALYQLDSEERILKLQAPSLAESLGSIPGIMVQKTGNGMSSPYIRGVTSQRNVLVIDGVRLNNSFLREGPNQYWSLIDPYFYDSAEVLMGPSSVMYGSDAIGGAINMITYLEQGLAGEGFQHLGGQALFRYSSAESSFSENIQSQMAFGDKLTLKLGLTRQDFGELKTGDHTHNEMTNYEQWSGNLRGRYWFDDNQSLYFGFDHFDQDDVDRTQKTAYYEPWQGTQADPSSDRRVYDHLRQSIFARYEMRNGKGIINEMDLAISYQMMKEDFDKVRWVAKGSSDFYQTKIHSLGADLRLKTLSDFGIWNYGLNFNRDYVKSSHDRQYVVGDSRYYDQGLVADQAYYDMYGAYLQNEYKVNKQWETIAGARYSSIRMDAQNTNLDGTTLGADRNGITDDLKGNWDALTLSGRVIYHALDKNRLSFFAGLSQGFRAPNLSDSTRDDEFGGGSELPTADLDAEKFLTAELGLKSRGEWGHFNAVIYHTWIEDRIGRLQQNSATGGGATKRNMDKGQIYGIEADLVLKLTDDASFFGDIAYSYGIEDNYYNSDAALPGNTLPLSRILPLTVRTGLRYAPEGGRFWAETYINMAESQDRLADTDTGNRFPVNGTPGYAVYNLRGGYKLTDNTDLTFALENITDKEYRIHGSGINEPGRNLVFTLKHNF